jgi:hypothetical protein
MGATAAGLAVIVGGGLLTGKGPAGSLKPKTALTPPPVMPNLTTQDQAATLAEAQSAAVRNGRASTILTNNQNTSDQLGP